MPVFSPIGAPPTDQQLLFKLTGANFQLTTDQIFTKVFGGTSYAITSLYSRQRSGGATAVIAVGGIYDAAGKTGNIIVAAAQTWATLALSSGAMVAATLTALTGTTILTNTPILSLTTGNASALTADLYIYGVDIS